MNAQTTTTTTTTTARQCEARRFGGGSVRLGVYTLRRWARLSYRDGGIAAVIDNPWYTYTRQIPWKWDPADRRVRV